MKRILLENVEREFEASYAEDPFVIPTETVYGLAARIDREASLKKIFEIKGRPSDNPLIVHVSSLDMLRTVVAEGICPEYKLLIDRFWPGPLSLIFKAAPHVSETVKGSCRDTVAVRMPLGPELRALIGRIGVPLAAPSANTSKRPSPTCVDHAIADLGEKVSVYIDGGRTSMGLESTVFGMVGGRPVILRPGLVTKEQIEEALGTEVAVQNKFNEGAAVISPGQKYSHYMPSVPLYLFKGANWKTAVIREMESLKGKRVGMLCSPADLRGLPVDGGLHYDLGASKQSWCRGIFAGLRELEKKSDVIFVHSVDTQDEGLAIMDRLEKAAHRVVDST